MKGKRKKIISYFVVLVIFIGLVIVNSMKSSFAFFVNESNGEIVTSAFYGHVVFDMNKKVSYTVNRIPFTDVQGGETALTIELGNYHINESNFEKSGNSSSLLDGDNSAIKVQSGGTLEYYLGNINTNGTYSPGIYEDGGKITINGTNITTQSSYSSGVVAANGGTTNLNYASVETFGHDSPAIHVISPLSVVNIYGGSYKTHEDNSPVIHANGIVSFNIGSNLISDKSDGIVIDTGGSVSLNGSRLTINNENSKGVILHQLDGDDENSTISFVAINSNISVNNGDVFYVTDTKAVIQLTNNNINANGGNFMRIESSQDGTNGGDVTLNMSNQTVNGDIVVDSASKIHMDLSNGSIFQGSIQCDNADNAISLKLSEDSKLILTGDTYISNLDNVDDTNSNIEFNGYDLYIDGEKVVIVNSSDEPGNNDDPGNDNPGNNDDPGNDNPGGNGGGEYLRGDMNHNGKIDLKDIILLIKGYLKVIDFDDLDITIGDMNVNGEIDLKDIILLIRKYLS